MHFEPLSTPTLLLDKTRLEANANRMLRKVRSAGVALRPHMKTAKSAAVAAVATDNRRYGITVSTLREARYFAEHGFDDITYAVGIVPSKLDQAAQLARQGVHLKVITDSVDVARAIAACDAPLQVLAETKAAVGDRIAVIMDSGVRRGSDIVKAMAIGADMVAMGLVPLDITAAAGEPGAYRALEIFQTEMDRIMAQLGLNTIEEIGPQIF